MKVFPGAAAYAAARAPGAPALAVAIGNFDGVHLGHRALLEEARARAGRRGGASAVLTFTPHPARLFAPAKAPPLIMSLERRLELCAEAGIDLAVVQDFTPAFAAIEAEAFVRRVLAEELGAADVVVGYDFSFGRGRAGTVARLSALGAELGIGVAVIPPVSVEGVACSSTRVRERCAAGDVRGAAALLGRPVELEGRVVRGAARGKALGFPTANLAPEGELVPALGIYAARARILDGPDAGAARKAALSVGRNPTFTGQDGQAPVTVEAYLLDFDGDLYDRRLRLEVLERLRDEQRFASVDALVAQIHADVARVRAIRS
ncbi:MAG TPA: bifunctional riboflavin kinase/FAD synthetase [Polyangia bacterium]|nr:bifunctional riboflavin kinase/FAD synthetase [Polyangia bacterium]